MDGLVLSLAPNGCTFNYRCAAIHGECTQEIDLDVKREIMRRVTNHMMADRWEDVNLVASFQVSLVFIVSADIESLSMKSQNGNSRNSTQRQEERWVG